MLEVLISIVIIAFGLLGVAGLQAYALKNNNSASLRLTATVLAADIIDRMRANNVAATALEYHKPNSADWGGAAANPQAGCTTAGGACTPAQMAEYDRWNWGRRVAAALPNGQGLVCLDSLPADGTSAGTPACDNGTGLAGGEATWVVKIWWTDDRNTGATAATPQLFWTAFTP